MLPGQLSETDQKLGTVRQLLQQSNFEGAMALLETLLEAEPTNPVVNNLLKVCYLQLKRFGNLELLTRRFIEHDSSNLSLRLDLADALANQGKAEAAREAYYEALRTVRDRDQNKYGAVLKSMLSHELESDAFRILDSLRLVLKTPNLFVLERGTLLERQKKYGDATREYFSILPRDTTQDGLEASRRTAAMLEFYESSPQVEQFLIDTTRIMPEPHVVRLLADFYIKNNRFDKAFDLAVLRDSLERMNGSYLGYYMQQCFERKYYPEVVRMGSYVFEHSRATAFVGNTPFLYASSLARTGRIDEACAIYDTIFAASPREQEKGDALYQIGMIHFDMTGNYTKALKYFDSVATTYRRGLSFLNAQKMIPYCYLKTGDLDAARKNFGFIRSQSLSAENAEEIAFNLSMISLYDKQYDSAGVGLRKLLVDYPQGFYINDAVQTLMVFDQADKDTVLLGIYSTALWFEQRGWLDSCKSWLGKLVTAENRSLADIALYRSILIDFRLNDTTAALSGIERLTADFENSYYVAFGLKMKADLLAEKMGRQEDAKAIYKQILEQFPNYPFASDVRKRLRQLESNLKAG